MSEDVKCMKCGKIVTDEAHEDANQQQFAGYNMMSIQYAGRWSAEQMESFLRSYDCKACRAPK